MTKGTVLRLGSRTSPLALAQTALVESRLKAAHEGLQTAFVGIRSLGDERGDPLATLGGTGIFTLALEEALEDGRIDLAVHSLKDLPTDLRPGLTLAGVLQREDPRDAVLTRGGTPFAELAGGSRVGTSSNRRAAFLKKTYPQFTSVPIRGNLDTRMRKLDSGEVDALVLAVAGLKRLAVARAFEALPIDVMLPAPGQGAIAMECRSDSPFLALIAGIDHVATHAATSSERSFLRSFGAGCQLPVGALAELVAGGLHLRGAVVDAQGNVFEGTRIGDPGDPEGLGQTLAASLIDQGASAGTT